MSYSHQDGDLAQTLYERFMSAGLSCFLDRVQLTPGLNWTSEIFDAIKKSARILTLMTPNSINNKWIFMEIGAAKALNKTIIPVVRALNHEEIPAILAEIQYLRVDTEEQINVLVNEILEITSISKDLRIHFKFESNSPYDLGYLLIDIYQLIVFSELLEEENYEALEQTFFNERFTLYRYNEFLKGYKDKIQIKELSTGSLTLVLTGIGVLASIIVPFVILSIQNYNRKLQEEVTFEIAIEDRKLRGLIDNLEKGNYGLDEEGMAHFLEIVSTRGYKVEVIHKDAYRITKILNDYGTRMARTISKYTRRY